MLVRGCSKRRYHYGSSCNGARANSLCMAQRNCAGTLSASGRVLVRLISIIIQ